MARPVLVSILLLCFLSAKAERRFYIRAQFGQQFATGDRVLFPLDQFNQYAGSTPHSMGGATQLLLTPGADVSDLIRLELGIVGSAGTPVRRLYEGNGYRYETVMDSRLGLTLLPSAVLHTRRAGKLNGHLTLSAVLPVQGRSYLTVNSANEVQQISMTQRWTYYQAVGGRLALGVEYALRRRLRLVADLSGTSLNRMLKRTEYTAYTINGNDRLGTLSESERTTLYIRDGAARTALPANQPSERDAQVCNFSSFGFSAGVMITF